MATDDGHTYIEMCEALLMGLRCTRPVWARSGAYLKINQVTGDIELIDYLIPGLVMPHWKPSDDHKAATDWQVIVPN